MTPDRWRLGAAWILAASLSAALAQGSPPTFPAPAAGKYGCTYFQGGVGSAVTFDPNNAMPGGATINNLNFNYLVPTTTPFPSPLFGTLTLDGKGKYTSKLGSGSYSYTPGQETLKFSGALGNASIRNTYHVSADGNFEIVLIAGDQKSTTQHYCELKVAGNPLPLKKNPNGALAGRLSLSTGQIDDLDLATGNTVTAKGTEGQRLYSGQSVYVTKSSSALKNAIVVTDAAGSRRASFDVDITTGDGWISGGALPSLSPDGRKVALYTKCLVNLGTADSAFYSSAPCLAVTDLKGKVLSSTTEFNIARMPPIWTRGGQIIYSVGENLVVADESFDQVHTITRGDTTALSPDGRYLAYANGTTLLLGDLAAGKAQARVLLKGLPIFALAWSPDGSMLAMIYQLDAQNAALAAMRVPAAGGVGKPFLLRDRYGEAFTFSSAVDATKTERLSWTAAGRP